MSWALVPFGELYAERSRNGLTRPKQVRGSGYKMVNMGELFAHDRIQDPRMDLVPLDDAEIQKFGLAVGDLLFARQSLVESGAGKCSIVLSVPETTCFESHIIRVRLDQRRSVPLYYYYYFRSPAGRASIEGIVTGAAQKGIRGSELAGVLVQHPPKGVQRRVAEILCAYDDLIENNNRRIALLEEIIQLRYREWFVYLRFPGHERVELVDGVPDGWRRVPIGELLEFHIGGGWGSEAPDHACSEPGHVIRGADIENVACGLVDDVPFRFHKPGNLASRRLAVGDVVFEVSGGSKTQGVGRSLVLTEHTLEAFSAPVMCASFCKRIVAKPPCTGLFLQVLLQHQRESGELAKYESASASNIINFRFKDFCAQSFVLLPTAGLLEEFTDQVAQMRAMQGRLSAANTRLKAARDLLLPRLMSGSFAV